MNQLEFQHQVSLQERVVVVRDKDEMGGPIRLRHDVDAFHIVDLIGRAGLDQRFAIDDSAGTNIPPAIRRMRMPAPSLKLKRRSSKAGRHWAGKRRPSRRNHHVS